MQPDYAAMVNDFVKPVVSLLLLVFLILGWVTAFRLMKEVTILRIKLGKEDERLEESFKIWLLRKSAPVVLPIYSFKCFLEEKEFMPSLKSIVTRRRKILKLAMRIAIVQNIVSSVIDFSSVRTNSK